MPNFITKTNRFIFIDLLFHQLITGVDSKRVNTVKDAL
jgi:hypothetical protein